MLGIEENYYTCKTSLPSIGPVCPTRGLRCCISIVDVSVGVYSPDNNTHKEMPVYNQDPSQEQTRHRGLFLFLSETN